MTSVPAPATHTARVPAQLVLWVAVAIAWVAIVVADATGMAGALHHHALWESGPPLPIAVGLFLIGWQVMVAAMMLPSSSTTVGRHGAAGFVGYVAIWAVFGLACFFGDGVIHRLVDTTPWLAASAWIVPTLSLAGAGLYQFVPAKRRFLEACRATGPAHDGGNAIRAGAAHAVDCVGASGPLMLLMFAAGFASLLWMVALSVLMFYEVRGRHASTAIRVSGVLLIWLALLTTMGGGVPGWAAV
jgi:predicted metal-binding membrane protein